METGEIHFYLMSFAFITGFLLQGALIALNTKNKRGYLLAAFTTLIVYRLSILFFGHDSISTASSSVMFPMMIMLLLMVIHFKDTVPSIGTQTVLLYTLFFWFVWHEAYYKFISMFLTAQLIITCIPIILAAYILHRKFDLSLSKLFYFIYILGIAVLWMASQFQSDQNSTMIGGNLFLFFSLLFLAIAITPIIATICIIRMAYTKTPLNFRLKLIAYIWFLLVAVSLIVSQFPSDLNSPLIKASASPIDILQKFLEVMLSSMFILQLAFYLAILVHIEPRDEDTVYEWKERTQMLVDKFSDLRLKPTWSLALCLAQVALLATNNFLEIIPNNSMIALLAMLSMQPVTGKEKDDAVVMNDLQGRTDELEEEPEQKQMERDRERLKELVSRERKRVESRN